MRKILLKWNRFYEYGFLSIVWGTLRRIDEAVGIVSLPGVFSSLLGGSDLMTTVILSAGGTLLVAYIWGHIWEHFWPESATEPEAPLSGEQLPETRTWVDWRSAQSLVRRSSLILKIKASWGEDAANRNLLQDIQDRLDGADRIWQQDVQLSEAVEHYLNKAVTEFPEIKKDREYSMQKLQWWLKREAAK